MNENISSYEFIQRLSVDSPSLQTRTECETWLLKNGPRIEARLAWNIRLEYVKGLIGLGLIFYLIVKGFLLCLG